MVIMGLEKASIHRIFVRDSIEVDALSDSLAGLNIDVYIVENLVMRVISCRQLQGDRERSGGHRDWERHDRYDRYDRYDGKNDKRDYGKSGYNSFNNHKKHDRKHQTEHKSNNL